MSVDLKLKISQLKISDDAKQGFILAGISVLEDANTYDIDNYKTILATLSPEVASEIKKVLLKYRITFKFKRLKINWWYH